MNRFTRSRHGIPRVARILKRGAVMLTAVFVTGAGVFGLYLGLLQYDGNFHAVIDGELYRSAQLNRTQFARVIRTYGIKSILNLRGPNPREPWYEDEVDIAHMMNVEHYDYAISARRIVLPRQVGDILAIIRAAPKPILVHCSAGADRSGLIAAIYLVKVHGVNVDIADQQLSIAYGHFPFLGSKTNAMDESFLLAAQMH